MELNVRRTGFAMLWAALLAAGLAHAQPTDYHQDSTDAGSYGNRRAGGSGNPNRTLYVERISPTLRVPVRTTPAQPLEAVTVRGHRDMYCTRSTPAVEPAAGDYASKKFGEGGGELNFRDALYRRLAALDAAAMQAALLRATGDRAAQYRELFGVELPALNGEWPFNAWADNLAEPQQIALNTGREVTLQVNDVVCATPAQVDAAIATARQVYTAVLAAMQSRTKTPQLGSKP